MVWRKQPRHGQAVGFPGAEEACDLLAVAARDDLRRPPRRSRPGRSARALVPQVTLGLSPPDGALLHQAHRSSDWVITVDRTLGMEYFDSPGSTRRPDYVIDFEGSADGGLGHHLVISSRSIDELRALLAPVIGQHGLAVDPAARGHVLRAAPPAVGPARVQAGLGRRRPSGPRCSASRSPGSTSTTRGCSPTRSCCRSTITWSCTATRGRRVRRSATR